MSGTSAIEWTDATWNAIRGCVKVSPGCANCYAEAFAERFRGVPGHPYEQGFDLRLVPEKLTDPLRWTKPRRIFVNSMSDLFQDGVPDEYIDQVFAVMALSPRHTFQVLTKRADRMRAYIGVRREGGRNQIVFDAMQDRARAEGRSAWGIDFTWPLPNVWLGVSVENQHFAEERIPDLLQTPAAVRFISAEPLLGPLDLDLEWLAPFKETDASLNRTPRLDWVIVGGESGRGARPLAVEWVRSIVKQCKSAGVPVFVKQLGASPSESRDTGQVHNPMSLPTSIYLKSRKGGDPSEWPADLRVREFPRVNA